MKRVLIIAYFFPPISNMGSHRIARFVGHLREFGWEPVVLTGHTSSWATDPALLEHLPAGVEIARVGGVDLGALWKRATKPVATPAVATSSPARSRTQPLTTFLNRWVMVPDKYFPWIRPAARAGERLIRERGIDAIYSTSDPLSDHLVGLRLARRTGVPWAAELRDLWLGSPYFARAQPTPVHRAWHARLERQVVATARTTVALSRGIQQYLQTTYPQRPCQVIYNCFEPADYTSTVTADAKFTVLYAGALYSSRSPEPFLAGYARFVQSRALTPDQTGFVWLGGSADLDVRGMAERHGLLPFVTFGGNVPHATALRRMQAASVLLLLQSPADEIHVPGKLFEYFGARRPILAVSRPCEVAELVERAQAGGVVEPAAAAVHDQLSRIHDQWLRAGPARLQTAGAESHGSRPTTQQLAALLDGLPGPRA